MSDSVSDVVHEPIHEQQEQAKRRREVLYLALLAMGVVYGDIGTSPLYAIRECFSGSHGVAVTRGNVLGVLSLVFWTLVILVTIKYHVYVIRANNRGEGGILALMSLVQTAMGGRRSRGWGLMIPLGLFGAALLYGDGALTPAISVLSAVEGLSVATSFFDPYVVPITVAVLVVLFMFQHHGTGGVGAVFGPIILVWFTTLAVLGLSEIVREPAVVAALNPLYAASFLSHNGWAGFMVLGAVFLVATGGEALYADLGHFGEKAIQIDWFCIVGPALTLNYFGQGALLLREPQAAVNPFYLLAPSWALYPLVALATAATIIASQAVITGVFSLTKQAVQLGYMPRVNVEHTSASHMGQIYIASVNWLLMAVTIGLVIGFGSSSAMAGAYGIAIASTMVITTILAFPVTWKVWGWPLPVAAAVTAAFVAVDLVFFSANLAKIVHGGWFPLVLAAGTYLLMTTWKRGRAILAERFRRQFIRTEQFAADLRNNPVERVPGTAIYMSSNPQAVPLALLHHLKHNRALHRRLVFLTVVIDPVPYVAKQDAIQCEELGQGLHRIVAHYGFMQEPNIPALLAACAAHGLNFSLMQTTFFLGRETLIATDKPGMAQWRKRLFVVLARNAQPMTSYFQIPPNRVIEVGAQVEI